jgi:hypothetical protein
MSEYMTMTADELRRAVAERLGWRDIQSRPSSVFRSQDNGFLAVIEGIPPGGDAFNTRALPDWTGDVGLALALLSHDEEYSFYWEKDDKAYFDIIGGENERMLFRVRWHGEGETLALAIVRAWLTYSDAKQE